MTASAGGGNPPALPKALIVAGPTCSGKSALALALAERLGGAVINADSMQIYRELRIVTARPSPAEEARAAHALYGVRPGAEPGSAAWWREAALAEMAAARRAGLLPILCGGTGLYLGAITQGISDIPDPGPAARAEARLLLAAEGSAALHARLAGCDPATAASVRPSDPQRVARAWEVWRGTGRGLHAWQARAGTPAPWRFQMVLLDPPRDELRAAIAARFEAMLRLGAVEEVEALLALGLDPVLPIMRAHGVPELTAYLRGELALPEAAERAVHATGRYVRRQATWFRNRSIADPSWTHKIDACFARSGQFSETQLVRIIAFVTGGVDGPP